MIDGGPLRARPGRWPAPWPGGDGCVVQLSELIGRARGEGGPNAAHQLAGDGAVGLRVAVAVFDHELAIERRQLRIKRLGDIGRLIESQAERGRALLGDGSRRSVLRGTA